MCLEALGDLYKRSFIKEWMLLIDYQILFMGTVWYLGLGTLFVLALAVLITQLKKNLLQIRELKKSQANSLQR